MRAAVAAHVEDGENVGVIEGGRRASLLLESLQAFEIQANTSGRIFSATSRPSRVSRARYTSPMPPTPIWAWTSYGPRRVPGERLIVEAIIVSTSAVRQDLQTQLQFLPQSRCPAYNSPTNR